MCQNRIIRKPLLHNEIMAICLFFFLTLGLAACQAISTGTPTPEGSALSFETIEQRDYSGTGTVYESKNPGIIIVSNKDEAKSLLGLITEHSLNQIKALDYDKFFVVGVFQGKKGSTEYSIQVEGVYRSENNVNILVTIHEPGPDELAGAMETSPYHVVKVQKTDNWGQNITFNMVANDQLVTSVIHAVP